MVNGDGKRRLYPSMFTRRTRPFGGAGVLRGYSAAVLDELAATDDEGLGGDVGEAELEQECARGARSRRKSRAR